MAWSQSGNIRGASGVPGASGASGAQGASGAAGASGGTGGLGASGPGFYRTIATLTEPTTVGASGNTDYVYLLSAQSSTVTYTPDSNDKLLLLGDAANNSTTFTDSATTPKTMTRNGSPVISTAQSKYGGSSMYFPNSLNNGTNYLSTTSSDFAFGTSGNFTVECWIYPTLFSDYNAICGTRQTSGNDANGWTFLFASTGELAVYSNGFYATSAASTITLNAWHHVAACRSGGTTRIFKNGVQVGTTTSFNTNLTNTSLTVASYIGDATQPFTGYIDELRIANVAKYTSSTSFTPPQFSTYTTISSYGTPTLPAAATANTNKSLYMFRNRSGASITVGASGSQQINGATGGLSLSNNNFVQLVSDGTGWYTIG